MSASINKPNLEIPMNIQQMNPQQASRTLLGSLSLNLPSIINLILLILYVIFVCYMFVNDPFKIVSQYPSVFVIILIIATFYMIYKNMNINYSFLDFRFNIVQNCIVLICLFIISYYLYSYNPGGYVMDYISLPIYILLFTTCIFGILYLMLFFYSASNSKSNVVGANSTDFKNFITNQTKILTVLKYFLGLAFFICCMIFLSNYLTQLIAFANSDDKSTGGYAKMFLNIILIIILAAIVYKIISYSAFYKNTPLYQLIINSIFYIPCLFVNLIDNFVKITGLGSPSTASSKTGKSIGMFNPSTTDFILLGAAIILNVIYFAYPYASNSFSKQGGKLLLNQPVFINEEKTLASYQDLNNDQTSSKELQDIFDYTYAISFWVYIDSASPSTSNAYSKYTSILNYGNKPNVLYKGTDNTLMITMLNSIPNTVSTPFELDDNGNRILYVKKDILLQKWNNIIINYTGGTLDIFYNGELVKSIIEVVPYMSYDNLVVGSKNGIQGGICSVNYFNKSLNIQQINNIYNFLKGNTPPVNNNHKEDIAYDLK